MAGGTILYYLVTVCCDCRVSVEVEQFCSGMNKVGGLWDLIMKDPLPWEEVFCKCRSVSKKFSSMKWKFNKVHMDQIGGKKKMKQSTAGRYFS